MKPQPIPFGPWEPDRAGINTRDDAGAIVLQMAKNVYPLSIGYGPVPALSALTATTLPAGCRGMVFARATSGGFFIFAGAVARLYKYVAGAWVDFTRLLGPSGTSADRTYNVNPDDYWSWTQFGIYLVACNINDDPQYIDIDSSGSSGNFIKLPNAPKARYVTTVNQFLVLGCLSSNNRKVMNSGYADITGWTLGVNLCDEQEFQDGGRVTGIAGGEFGWIVQEKALRTMTLQPGSDVAFRIDRIEKEHGAAAGYAAIAVNKGVYFLADDGFYRADSNGLSPIGAQRINKWFQSNSDTARFWTILGFSDPYAPRIGWAFFATSGSTVLDRILWYDWQLDKWSYTDVSVQFIASIVTSGVTLEELDAPYPNLDTDVPFSLDSRVWEGGRPVIGAIDATGRLAFLEATVPLDAQILTAPMQLQDGGLTTVSSIEPMGLFNDASPTVRVGKFMTNKDSPTYTAAVPPSTRTGVCRLKSKGRFHQVELNLTQSSGTLWKYAQGFQLESSDGGKQ